MITKELIREILDAYVLTPSGIHGIRHWARVLVNGHRLAESTCADLEVVGLFAVFHDACRVSDGSDPDHGLRGAELAKVLRGRLFDLSDDQFELLYSACAYHTRGKTDGDKTILTCWDADRLDLPRVGITPKPRRLCTSAARKKEIVKWSTRRAITDEEPPMVRLDWGLHDL